MPFIFTKSNLSFRGPFTGNETALFGETKVTLTTGQYADFNTLDRSNANDKPILFSDSNSTTFFYGTLDQSSLASPSLQWGLIFLFRKISQPLDRAKLYPLYCTLSVLFKSFGSNCESNATIKSDIKVMIQNALTDEDSSELLGIQAQMLALPQWG